MQNRSHDISDPLGFGLGLGEVLTCVYDPAVACSLPDPLISAYRHLALHVSILDGTILNRFKQSVLRGQMSDDVLVGKIRNPVLMKLNFRNQLKFRMGGQRKGPVEVHPDKKVNIRRRRTFT